MKHLFILWILISQWQVFSSECDLTFDNKNPDHIINQIEEIYLMDIETGLLCFNELKTFLIEPWDDENSATKDIQNIIDSIYGNDRRDNLERIEYLMSLLLNTSNAQDVKPNVHSEISSQQMSPIRITLTQITQTPTITSNLIESENIPSDLDTQVKQLQSQRQQTPIFWNPYFFFPSAGFDRNLLLQNSPRTPPRNQIETIDTLNVDSTTDQQPRQSFEEEYIWTETFQIEFPAIVLCRTSADDMSRLFFRTLKKYEDEIIEFTNQNLGMEQIYIDIMEWLDSIRNQNGYHLQNSHPIFDVTSYSVQLNQVPDFILDGMTTEQEEKFKDMMNFVRKYVWMYNLHFEYRKCLPTAFREHLLLSYSVPAPLEMGEDPEKPVEDYLDINLFYEFSTYTSPFASAFKQNYPLYVLQQNNVSWNDFESNELRNRYEANWVKNKKCEEEKKNKEDEESTAENNNEEDKESIEENENEENIEEECKKIPESKWKIIPEFLETFISKNRTYLNVSF
ncbi:MAG: hypothetical protein OXK80_00140 [Bdellovibrionales bacterium]|nr:hypothetical protein [Bdellovibrionales bacterium]